MRKGKRFPRSPLALFVYATALLVGCKTVYSLHPLFADDDLVLDQRLAGSWMPDTTVPNQRWVVFRLDTSNRVYQLALTDSVTANVLLSADFADDSATRARLNRDPALRARRTYDSTIVWRVFQDSAASHMFDLRLGRLDGVLFADITVNPDFRPRNFPHPLLLPVHWFWRVSFEADRLSLVPLNDEWLGKMIDSNTVRIPHEKTGDDDLLLTAPTHELQGLVARYAADTLAFPRKNGVDLRR
jgi:hypothetical protein